MTGSCLDVLKTLPDESVHCVVTSPPYWGLRDYEIEGQIGLETTPEEYVRKLVDVFREVRRVLRKDATLWLVLGDSYAGGGRGGNPVDSPFRKQATNVGSLIAPSSIPRGLKPKDLLGIPWRVAFALQADGWWLRSDIIYAKLNPMPESVTDRPTSAHEHVFLLARSKRYYFDADAVRIPQSEGTFERFGNNRAPRKTTSKAIAANEGIRNVWTIATEPFPEAHFATFPCALVEPCIKAGCPKGGTVLDCFGGAGTTGLVADRLGRDAILIELNPEYAAMARRRINDDVPLFTPAPGPKQEALL